MKIRLHQFLARAGVAKNNFDIMQMVKKGRVRVDKNVVTAESFIFDSKLRRVYLDDEEIKLQPARFFVVNKPKGHSCQRGEYPNVTDLLDNILKSAPASMRSIFVVGRLDRDTEGLILLTNDGKVASKILQPAEKVEKEYEALVEGSILDESIKKLQSGVTIVVDSEDYKTAPAKAEILKRVKIPAARKTTSLVRISITEGKKRQVRQMFEAVGHPVISLKRVRIGSLRLANMGDRWVVEVSRTEIMNALSI